MIRKPLSRKAKSAPRRTKPAARPHRNHSPDELGTLAASGVKALALPIESNWQTGITFNLQLLFKHAALIDGFALPDESEPAPVFRA
jgi:hypothetical protein